MCVLCESARCEKCPPWSHPATPSLPRKRPRNAVAPFNVPPQRKAACRREKRARCRQTRAALDEAWELTRAPEKKGPEAACRRREADRSGMVEPAQRAAMDTCASGRRPNTWVSHVPNAPRPAFPLLGSICYVRSNFSSTSLLTDACETRAALGRAIPAGGIADCPPAHFLQDAHTEVRRGGRG